MDKHIKCGGNLTFVKHERNKTWFRCDKCHQLVNVYIAPSYNGYVKRKML